MILAIDPSLSCTATFLGDERGYIKATHKSVNGGNGVRDRMARFDELVNRILDFAERADKPIDLILIEGYSFGSTGQISSICEFGGLLRWHLIDICERDPLEVPPSSLKKFATGKGSVGKDIVCAHLARAYDVEFSTNDEYDAFALFRLGLVILGLAEAKNQAQREVVQKLVPTQPAAAGDPPPPF